MTKEDQTLRVSRTFGSISLVVSLHSYITKTSWKTSGNIVLELGYKRNEHKLTYSLSYKKRSNLYIRVDT